MSGHNENCIPVTILPVSLDKINQTLPAVQHYLAGYEHCLALSHKMHVCGAECVAAGNPIMQLTLMSAS